MVIIECEQRSDEWHQARLGVVTASNSHRILTPTGKASEQAEAYMCELLAEKLTGKTTETFESEWMARGKEVEDEARDWYEFHTDRTVRQVGFIYKDESRLVGCSPDGLCEGRGLEVKCPKAGTHVGYMYRPEVPTKYRPQPQFSMWVTGLEEWEWLSYHPDLDSVIIPVRRDEAYIRILEAAVNTFTTELVRRLAILTKPKAQEAA